MRHRPGAVLAAALASFFALASAADAAEPPPGASSCSGCHGTSPNGTPIPVLRGRAALEIAGLMREFRSGARPATVMGSIAKGFNDREIDVISQWVVGQSQ